MNKFWAWMEKKGYGLDIGKHSVIVSKENKFSTIPSEQMLIGYKIEYLEERVGRISIRKYENLWFIDEANSEIEELGKELAYNKSLSKALDKAISVGMDAIYGKEEVSNEKPKQAIRRRSKKVSPINKRR